MKRSSEYAELTEIRKEQLVKMPLILHRRIGLQRMIADWADTDIGGLNVTATYNVIHGSPITFVENNMRYFADDQRPARPETGRQRGFPTSLSKT